MSIFTAIRGALTAGRKKLSSNPAQTNPKSAPVSAPLSMASIIRPQVRERWLLPQVGAITPQYIEMTLRGALAGAHVPQWELFNLMEDTWPRLRKNVLELKTAVRNRRPVFEAYREEDEEESPTATERMKLVSAALRGMQPDPTADESAYGDMVNDILDAWFKGVSVLEIDWQIRESKTLGRFVAPRCTRWASPINYAWSGDLRIGLSDYQQNTLNAFPADKFIIAKCKTKSGSILGGALLRPLVWWWCAANFSADWLLNLAQIFGLPFRWANFDPTAAPETIDRICAMLQNMGSAGWAAFPSGTTMELKTEGMKPGAETPQGDMLDRADKQCDLLVLGQTLTTDTGGMGAGGGSKALGEVHQDVRAGVIEAASRFVADTLELQLIPSILRLNYGETEEAPSVKLEENREEDLTAKAGIIVQLKNAGAGKIISLDWLGKTFGIPKPEEGEETLADEEPEEDPEYEDDEDIEAAAARLDGIDDDALFARELQALYGGDGQFHGNQYVTVGGSAGKRRATEREKKAIRAAHAEIAKVMRQEGDYTGKINIPGVGDVRLSYGQKGKLKPDEKGATHTGGYGLFHIADKHGQKALKRLPHVLIRGKRGPWQESGKEKGTLKRMFTHGRELAVLGQKKGSPIVITSFDHDAQ